MLYLYKYIYLFFYIYIHMSDLTLVDRVLNYIKWVEFSHSHCLSSVASGNQSRKMNYKD